MVTEKIDGYRFSQGCALCDWLKACYLEGKKPQIVFLAGMRMDIYATHQLQHSIDALREVMLSSR